MVEPSARTREGFWDPTWVSWSAAAVLILIVSLPISPLQQVRWNRDSMDAVIIASSLESTSEVPDSRQRTADQGASPPYQKQTT
jgi:hypothetical protein